jgi:hypothetical protein
MGSYLPHCLRKTLVVRNTPSGSSPLRRNAEAVCCRDATVTARILVGRVPNWEEDVFRREQSLVLSKVSLSTKNVTDAAIGNLLVTARRLATHASHRRRNFESLADLRDQIPYHQESGM